MMRTDVVVIGAGSAGLSAARSAIDEGVDVVLIDHGPLGTKCARVGCMPSKALIAVADAAERGRWADDVRQLKPRDARTDGAAVLEHVRTLRDGFVDHVKRSMAEMDVHFVEGRARFEAPGVVAAGGERIQARAVVVATGVRPVIPPPLKPVAEHVRTYRDVFELTAVPERLAVVGAGPVGLELGQAMSRLGAEVTLLDAAPELTVLSEPELRRCAQAVLAADLEGLHLGAELVAATGGSHHAVRLTWRASDGIEHTRGFDLVLAAAGTTPNLDPLGLDEAFEDDACRLGDDGLPRGLDPETLQIGDQPVFLAGDVDGLRPLLHEAVDDGRIAGVNAARFPKVLRRPRRTRMSLVFTRPAIAEIGRPYREEHAVGRVDFGDQGRARSEGRAAGELKVWADRAHGTLIGGAMVAPDGEHLAHLLAWLVQLRVDVGRALALPFYHPTVEEGLRTALRDLECDLSMAPTAPALVDGPGC